jgi:hypothetical protein
VPTRTYITFEYTLRNTQFIKDFDGTLMRLFNVEFQMNGQTTKANGQASQEPKLNLPSL